MTFLFVSFGLFSPRRTELFLPACSSTTRRHGWGGMRSGDFFADWWRVEKKVNSEVTETSTAFGTLIRGNRLLAFTEKSGPFI